MEPLGAIETAAATRQAADHIKMAVLTRGALGSLILSGGITEAVTVNAGDSVNLRLQSLGSVGVRFV